MKASTYAHAIERLIASGVSEAKIADNLIAQLKSRGRMKLLSGILSELTVMKARRTTVAARVEVAHEKDAAHALTEARAEGIDAKEAHVNHTLISGWRAQSKGMLADRSGKRALLDLYRNVTKA